MNSFKDKTIKIGVSILMGITMASAPLIFANDESDAANAESSEQRLNRMAAEKASRVARVNELANTWSAHTREPRANLFQAFYALSDSQLSAVETADNYQSVRAIAFGQGSAAAAKGVGLQAKLGDIFVDLVFIPVLPCRIIDTRNVTNGTFTDNTTMSYFTYGADLSAQGGEATGCTSPRGDVDPSAVHININAIPRLPEFNNGRGTVKVTPQGAAPSSTVLVKFNLGDNVSNAVSVIAARGVGEEIDIRTTGNPVDIVVEILGYYYPVEEIDANGVAIAHGYINLDGTQESGTDNVTSTWNAGSNRYEITITDETYFFSSYTTLVTQATFGECNDVDISTSSGLGNLWVRFRDLVGTGAGTDIQCPFAFVTFKNKSAP